VPGEVATEYQQHEMVIHARRSAGEAAFCGAGPGSPWTSERIAFVTCRACRREIERRLAARGTRQK
jgi:hypothetical protein